MKKLLIICLSAALLASSLMAFSGCENEEAPTDAETVAPAEKDDDLYKVKIVDENGAPVVGATLMITDSKGIFINAATDTNGEASAEADASGLGVMIIDLPEGYKKPDTVSGAFHALFEDKKELTLAVGRETEELATYTFELKDQNGDPIIGASLQLCPDGTCLASRFVTDENGILKKDMKPDIPVDVKILSLPDGYEMPDVIADGFDGSGYHARIAAGEYKVTITVTNGNNE